MKKNLLSWIIGLLASIPLVLGLEEVQFNETAFNLIFNNQSIIKGAYTVYTSVIGGWFWVLLLLFLMVVTYLGTQDLTYVFIFTILGSMGLASYGLLPAFVKPVVYIIMGLSLMLTLYAFFVRKN